MIVFFYGTTAEAIKLAPVARRLTDQGVEYEQWLTLQQADTVLHALPGLGLPAPDHVLANGRGCGKCRSVFGFGRSGRDRLHCRSVDSPSRQAERG